MKFSTVIIATASLLAAGVVNAAPAVEVDNSGFTPIGVAPVQPDGLEKRDQGGIYVCQGFNWAPPCAKWVLGWNSCSYVNDGWWNTISSAGADSGTGCVLYNSPDCSTDGSANIGSGGSLQGGDNNYWGQWNDNVRSIKCWW